MKQLQLLQHLESPSGEERFLVSGSSRDTREAPQKPRVKNKGRGKSTISTYRGGKDSTVLWLPPIFSPVTAIPIQI